MARKRHRRRWGRWLLLGLLLLPLIYLIVSPIVLPWLLRGDADTLWRVIAIDEWIRQAAMVALLAAWVFMFGAAVGSFLNVVAWRMPRGESVVSRPSHCPYCHVNIRAYDNLPVFGWLLLGGRCRACRLPISPRYPIVEALLGSAFLILAVAEPLRHGANLPSFQPPPRWEHGVVSLVTSPDWLLLGIYGYHCLLISLLAAFALIKYDRHRLPVKLLVAALLLGFVFPAVWPGLHPLHWETPLAPGLQRIDTSLIGLLIAGFWGQMLSWGLLGRFDDDDPRRRSWSSTAPGLALVGLFLGWQSGASVLLLAAMMALIAAAASHAWAWLAKAPLCGWIGLATLVHLACWRQLETSDWWPGDSWPMWRTFLAVVVGVAAVALAARIGRRPEFSNYNVDRPSDATPQAAEPIEPIAGEAEPSVSPPLQSTPPEFPPPANEGPSS
ncbi:MAG: prepilin peptidase [Pirellulaceae bacterium]